MELKAGTKDGEERMTGITNSVDRQRTLYAVAIALVIGTGLLWRSRLFPLPEFLAKYGGDALWALVVFLGCGFVFRRRPPAQIAWLAVGLAWAVEFSQLYHAPWLDGIRSTPLGRLALGATFNSPDLLAYLVGIAGGALAERRLFKPNQET